MIRLTDFHAKNFRSLADVELARLPQVVLLFGENDTGKSNVLRAIGAWLRLLDHLLGVARGELLLQDGRLLWLLEGQPERTPALPLERAVAERVLGAPVDAQLRHDEIEMELRGRLAMTRPASSEALHIDIAVKVVRRGLEEAWVTAEVMVLEWSGIDLRRGKISPSDEGLRALRDALRGAWFRISSDRRFHQELQPSTLGDIEIPIGNDGEGLLLRMLQAYTGTDRRLRQAFRERLVPMLSNGLFPRGEPVPTVDGNGRIDLWLGDRSIREFGSGVRQWALIASMLVLSDAKIVGLEEPEANLSWQLQIEIGQKLAQQVSNQAVPPFQLFITSHSRLVYDTVGETRWFEVLGGARGTEIRGHEDRSALDRYFPGAEPVPAPRPGSMRIYPGHAVWLHPSIAEHLGAEVGSFVYALLGERGEIRLLGERRFEQLEAAAEAAEAAEVDDK